MFKLDIQIPEDHSKAAVATLRDGKEVLLCDFAAAPMTSTSHFRLDSFYLIGSAHQAGNPVSEYGEDQFLFYSVGSTPRTIGQARLDGMHRGLLAYAGALGADNALRRAQDGLRLSNEMSAAIIDHVLKPRQKQRPLLLTLRPLRRPWWAFWRGAVETPPLSSDGPQKLGSLLSERTLLQELLRRLITDHSVDKSIARNRKKAGTRDNDTQRDSGAYSSNSSENSSSNNSDSFRGQGGQSGGAGASGSWGAPAAGLAAAGALAGAGAVFAAHASPFSDIGSGGEGNWLGGTGSSSGSSGSSSSSSSDSYSSSDSSSFSSSDSGGSSSDSGGSSGGGD